MQRLRQLLNNERVAHHGPNSSSNTVKPPSRRSRRPPGCARFSPQPRANLVGCRRLSRDAERRSSGNRQRHRSACGGTLLRAQAGMTWWPSDIYKSHLKSIAAWRTHSGVANLRPPQRIDLSDPDWSWTGDADRNALLTAMLCINVLHISPWRVSQESVCRSGPIPAKAWPPVCVRPIPA